MGIEKLQPSVVLKDVERRVQVLRKTQIRNTALRFRFQMTIQKLSTYQAHWQRICRQIEEGTYKRDVRRANERFGAAGRRARARDIEVDVNLDDLDVTELGMDDLEDRRTLGNLQALSALKTNCEALSFSRKLIKEIFFS